MKKITLFLSTLISFGVLIATSTTLLTSCTTSINKNNSNDDNNSGITDDEYDQSESNNQYISIDWSNSNQVDKLVKDDNGIIYSDSSKSNIVAIRPESNLTNITIPSTVISITGYINVTNNQSIYTGAFENNKSLILVDFENGSQLKNIGDKAFSNCSNLEKINLYNTSSLEVIGYKSFYNNTLLKNVTLPNSIESNIKLIGDYAFSDCASLANICPEGFTGFVPMTNISNYSKSYSSSKSSYITKSGIGSLAFSKTAIKTIDLSKCTSTLTPFAPAAFKNMLELTKITFGDETLIYELPYSLFENDTNLEELVLPESIKEIANGDNNSNYSIDDIYNENDNDNSPFYNSGIKTLDLSKISSYSNNKLGTGLIDNDGNELLYKDTLPNYLFEGMKYLSSVTLKANTTNIGIGAFKNAISLIDINVPEENFKINGKWGFYPTSILKNISKDAFNGAFRKNEVYIGSTLDLSRMSFIDNTIPRGLFSNSLIYKIVLPTSVTTIEDNSFTNMTNLCVFGFENEGVGISVGTKSNLKTIGRNNFTNLQLITIDLSDSKLESIGSGSFIDFKDEKSKVLLPNTYKADNYNDIFYTKFNERITIGWPNGLESSVIEKYINNNVISGNSTYNNENLLSFLCTLDLSSFDDITSIGVNSFYGPKISNITLSAKNINKNTNLFLGNNLTVNDDYQAVSPNYSREHVPFGYNCWTVFEKGLKLFYEGNVGYFNYKNFPNKNITVPTNAEELFNNTGSETWEAVSKVINSFSLFVPNFYGYINGAYYPPNLSLWEPWNTNEIYRIDNDVSSTFQENSVTLSNSYKTNDDISSSTISISSSDKELSFYHNGIEWTYTNNGQEITLKGKVNSYKVVDGSNSYIVYFGLHGPILSNNVYTDSWLPSWFSTTVELNIATK